MINCPVTPPQFCVRIGNRDDFVDMESLRGLDDAQSDLAPVGNE